MDINEQIIERYKAEMQKMITDLKKNDNFELKEENKTENIIEPRSQMTNLVSDFPTFEQDTERLNRRIEEILEQNSDVALESDMPANLNETQQPETKITQNQGDLLMSDDEILIDGSMQRQPEMPTEEEMMQNQDLEAPQNPPQAQTQEQMGEMVSRVCIRGGAKAQYSPPANTGPALGTSNQLAPNLNDSATLKVETFAANRAIPVKDALIRVINEETGELVLVLKTNSSGDSGTFSLPAPDRNLSLQPDSVHPFVNYLVDVSADGYIPQNNLNVQLFGGINSSLPINLIPVEI